VKFLCHDVEVEFPQILVELVGDLFAVEAGATSVVRMC
jgi:hypothetical protein